MDRIIQIRTEVSNFLKWTSDNDIFIGKIEEGYLRHVGDPLVDNYIASLQKEEKRQWYIAASSKWYHYAIYEVQSFLRWASGNDYFVGRLQEGPLKSDHISLLDEYARSRVMDFKPGSGGWQAIGTPGGLMKSGYGDYSYQSFRGWSDKPYFPSQSNTISHRT